MAGGKKAQKAGSSAESQVKKWFEAQGYEVIMAPKGTKMGGKFVPSKDFFGLFDLIAVGNGAVKFVQVKSGVACRQPKNLAAWKARAKEWQLQTMLDCLPARRAVQIFLALKYPLRDEPDLEEVV